MEALTEYRDTINQTNSRQEFSVKILKTMNNLFFFLKASCAKFSSSRIEEI